MDNDKKNVLFLKAAVNVVLTDPGILCKEPLVNNWGFPIFRKVLCHQMPVVKARDCKFPASPYTLNGLMVSFEMYYEFCSTSNTKKPYIFLYHDRETRKKVNNYLLFTEIYSEETLDNVLVRNNIPTDYFYICPIVTAKVDEEVSNVIILTYGGNSCCIR
jgi:hypothetical protein